MGFDEVSRTWTRLGAADPMWAVLTDRGKSARRWRTEDFLATGSREIEHVLARLAELGVEPRRERAIDFGCGAGRLCHGLAQAGFDDVLGLDISPTMLTAARETVTSRRCRFHQVHGADLGGVETGSIDLVYSCRVLQHLPPQLAQRYVREFWRIAAPGAAVVFQLPTEPARNLPGLALRLLPGWVATKWLRRGMEMHGTRERVVRSLADLHGVQVVAADPDDSAGPRWDSRLYVTVGLET